MKLSKSKLALAKVINENGGWCDGAKWAAQDKRGTTCKLKIWFYSGNEKPYTAKGCTTWQTDYKIHDADAIQHDKLLPNWHQTCLSREEYHQAYPKADADGWIEWKGGECPVSGDDIVDVAYSTYGAKSFSAAANSLRWSKRGLGGDIIAYRLHKPEVKPELCESVMRSIPDPESKPTIEQLAQDYRNKLDLSNRKQQEADDAKAAADAALVELELAGEALGLLIGIAKSDQEPELVITDWRDLMVGDVVEITGSSNNCWKDHSGQEMTVKDVYPEQGDNDDQVDLIGESGDWCLGGNTTWRFIRRP